MATGNSEPLEIAWVCDDCGKKYGWVNVAHKRENAMGRCNVCQKITSVSAPASYGHLPNLLHRAGVIVPDEYGRGRLRYAANQLQKVGI
jgi:hypothetical protein